ncbi:MAG TPA: endonuclease/exonuclease/phosphatase family protein [Solirubrobacteraceae bacterium]|nr:endonuclease/exonuclease/phosphatase family protein [Solirubrobacteraceae bacterium]
MAAGNGSIGRARGRALGAAALGALAVACPVAPAGAAIRVERFDQPEGTVLADQAPGLRFPDAPVVFTPQNTSTSSPTRALRSSQACGSGCHRLRIEFPQPVSYVRLRVGLDSGRAGEFPVEARLEAYGAQDQPLASTARRTVAQSNQYGPITTEFDVNRHPSFDIAAVVVVVGNGSPGAFLSSGTPRRADIDDVEFNLPGGEGEEPPDVVQQGGGAQVDQPFDVGPQFSPFTLMTYNAQFLPGPLGTGLEYDYGIDERPRARAQARRIVASGAHVVALNEVFDHDGRRALMEGLKTDYTHRIEYIDGYRLNRTTLGNSGLAIVSKWPFLPLPSSPPPPWSATLPQVCLKRSGGSCVAAFHVYVNCAGADCLSSKGLAYVRLANPHTGRPLNVFFTHMQAHNGTRDKRARRKQIVTAQAMIASYTRPDADEDTVLMGDLNPQLGSPDYEAMARELRAMGFVDVRETFGLPDDPGWTGAPPWNSRYSRLSDAEHLDYMFLRSGGDHACAQEFSIERYRVDKTSLSDHEPLRAVLAPRRPRCSAADAERNPTTIANRVLAPLAASWYRYDAPGTYVVEPQGGVEVDALESTGRPARRLVGRTRGYQVVAVRGPLYLRVRNPGPSGLGYGLAVRRSEGASRADALALDPERAESLPLAGSGATRWFRVTMKRPAGGGRTGLAFATAGHPGARVRLTLYDGGRSVARTGFRPNTQRLAGRLLVPRDRVTGDRNDYHLAVESQGAAPGATLRWETGVATLDLSRLFVRVQEDDRGDDHVRVRVRVDGGAWRTLHWGRFDGGQAKYFPQGLAGIRLHDLHYAERVQVQIFDADSPDDDDDLGTWVLTRAGASREPSGEGYPESRRFGRSHGADYRLLYWASVLP